MNYLLDTCTFLWLTGQSAKLSSTARDLCADPDHVLFLSAAPVWEIEIKYRLGRLTMAVQPERFVPEQRVRRTRSFALPFEEGAALRHGRLPGLHKDPFDRMLVCQAQEHGLTIITPDKKITAYPVNSVW